MKLQTRVVASIACASLLIGSGVAAWIGMTTGRQILDLSLQQMNGQVEQMTGVLDAYRMQTESLAEQQMDEFSASLRGEWSTRGRAAIMPGEAEHPVLLLGNKPVAGDVGMQERFTASGDKVATIFVRDGDECFRVATSVKREDGTPATGTSLGVDHPARVALLKGHSYTGRARLFGRDYITNYLPVTNRAGDVVGALFVGIDFSASLKALNTAIDTMKIGRSGYAYIVDVGSGAGRGNFLAHPLLASMPNAHTLKDAGGRLFLAEVADSRAGVIRYLWQQRPDAPTVEKYSVYRTYAPWSMQVHFSLQADEYREPAYAAVRGIVIATFLGAILMSLIATYMVRRFVLRPLGGEPVDAAALAEAVASGDVGSAINAPPGTLLGSLAETARRMELALDGGGLGIWDINLATGRFRYNGYCAAILGMPADQLPATVEELQWLLNPDDRAMLEEAAREHLRGDTPLFTREFRVRHSSQGWIWLLARGRVVASDATGKPSSMTGTIMDISSKKKIEAELKARESWLESLIASMQDIIVVLDMDGRVSEYFHPAFARRPPPIAIEAMRGKLYSEILPPEASAAYDSAIAEVLTEEHPVTFEYLLEINGKRYVSQATMSAMFAESGYPTSFLSVIRDVTDERLAR